MSRNTNVDLRKQFIYQVYLRNHTKEGTIQAFIKDLDRIKDLGVDVVYLLPIHEVGMKNKKGELGCPYSIKDYRSINHEYGTIDDFKQLIEEVHNRGMELMIDVVYNHTSYDSVLINEHPEYFYKVDGEFKNRVGDWWDITDLDYSVDKGLWEELISTLEYWTKLGVDGYRWDVASLLPLEFLEEAHERVLDINKNVSFLSESVHGGFLRYIRSQGFKALSESEVYSVFDSAYDYDTHPYFEGYLKGENSLRKYAEEVLRQEEIYPENYIKLRNLENHDFGRFAPMVDMNLEKIKQWTALVFFLKGSTMVYAGQERCDHNKPSLFDKDDVNWDGEDISDLMKTMSLIVKDDAYAHGHFNVRLHDEEVFVAEYDYKGTKTLGIFNLGLETGLFHLDIKDGEYKNEIDGEKVEIKEGKITLTNKPVIIVVG